MTQPPDDAALVASLRKRLAEAPAQPWAYRPDKYDDWGFIRGPERDDLSIGPFRPIVALGKDSMVSDADMSAHRAAKTDPYGPSSLLIVDAVNALPGLLDALEAKDRRIAELEAGWQGMESAPMDGTPLLLFARCVTATAPGILVGWYIPDRWIELSFTGPVGIVPYAWQPLPGFPSRAALEPSDKGVGR